MGTDDARVRGRFVRRFDRALRPRVAAYDKGKPLVIGPVLAYSTYLGGNVREARVSSRLRFISGSSAMPILNRDRQKWEQGGLGAADAVEFWNERFPRKLWHFLALKAASASPMLSEQSRPTL
jgi:hypothetical protein